jgi:Tfp pilus assembly PilM family ATPase
VGELIDELRAAVRYHAVLFPGREIDDLIFVGGCAADTGICQRIAQSLRLPAQLADPLSQIDRAPGAYMPVDASSPQPGWALAYGLTAAPTEE